MDTTGRHPATAQVARWFEFGHLPAGPVADTSAACHDLAQDMINRLPDGPELTSALRKLLEAKDGFVRAAIEAQAGPAFVRLA